METVLVFEYIYSFVSVLDVVSKKLFFEATVADNTINVVNADHLVIVAKTSKSCPRNKPPSEQLK